MSGLFGGTKTVYVPQPAPATAQPETTVATNSAKKGATDLEKMAQSNELTRAYNKTAKIVDIGLSSGDTTLSSGSLLSLGSKLG